MHQTSQQKREEEQKPTDLSDMFLNRWLFCYLMQFTRYNPLKSDFGSSLTCHIMSVEKGQVWYEAAVRS